MPEELTRRTSAAEAGPFRFLSAPALAEAEGAGHRLASAPGAMGRFPFVEDVAGGSQNETRGQYWGYLHTPLGVTRLELRDEAWNSVDAGGHTVWCVQVLPLISRNIWIKLLFEARKPPDSSLPTPTWPQPPTAVPNTPLRRGAARFTPVTPM